MSRPSNNPLSGHVTAGKTNTAEEDEDTVSADEGTPASQRVTTPTPTDLVVKPLPCDHGYATGMDQQPSTSAFGYRRRPASSGACEDGLLATARDRLRHDTAIMDDAGRLQRQQEPDDTSGNISDGSSSSETTSETSTKRLKNVRTV